MVDPIDGGGTPPENKPAADSKKKCTCEFCECVLTPGGEVMVMSDRARRYRDLAEDNKKLEGSNETLRDENERLKEQLKAANPQPTADKKSAGLRI